MPFKGSPFDFDIFLERARRMQGRGLFEDDIRAIAERFWQRDPLAFLGVCAEAKLRGLTLLDVIRKRVEELRSR